MTFHPDRNPIFLFKTPINIRQNHEGLSAIIKQHFGENFLVSGAAFIFISRNRRICKILYFDGTGLVMIHKKFAIRIFPHVNALDEINEITYQDFKLLFKGGPHRISV